ncbi:MAG: Maf family protein [Burkholderiaceae bacterium]
MPNILVLASTSRYRRELLTRLRIPFDVIAPHVDETAQPGETPRALSLRLAQEKALAVARQLQATRPDALVIGSDQVAEVDGHATGKPGDIETALAQLARANGKTLTFHTGIAVAHAGTLQIQTAESPVVTRFAQLPEPLRKRYLELEQPFDCAGSMKSEALGIALAESIESGDPTALIGLPLIATIRLLRSFGFEPLEHAR